MQSKGKGKIEKLKVIKSSSLVCRTTEPRQGGDNASQ
jgi:hypothetical protein